MTWHRYPLAPLFELTGWTMTDVRDLAPCGGEEYRLRLERGVTERIADRLAVAAGLHPHVVWPEMADHAIEDAEQECADERCTATFVPTRKSHRYCSPRCFQRAYKRAKYRERYANDPAFREAELARARAKRTENQRARKIKARAYYLANAEKIRAKARARKAARREQRKDRVA